MNIVVTDWKTVSKGDLDESLLTELGNVTFYPLTAPKDIVSRIADAEVLLCNKTPITAEVMAAAPRLKYIGLFATGYNNIDINAAAKRGITVCNAGGYSTHAVAQHTFALLLALSSRVVEYHTMVQKGDWISSDVFSPFGHDMLELHGKTIGLVGYGSIGQAVAAIALALGMKVLCHTRTPKTAAGVRFVSFEELLSQSDVVSVHCPLTAQTEKLFNAEAFRRCKQGALFINTARGPIVDESALCEALVSGKLGGAAVDVLETEPMAADCPLRLAPRCIITPHVAWAPLETRTRLLRLVRENLQAYTEGHPQNVITAP
ncbi:MAG: D-2-hydroxyacid dehydrogenase [Clostridia bacterium]|nr:D-2-hydroxyacid dehydrogenase [Clostridia bacterium]